VKYRHQNNNRTEDIKGRDKRDSKSRHKGKGSFAEEDRKGEDENEGVLLPDQKELYYKDGKKS